MRLSQLYEDQADAETEIVIGYLDGQSIEDLHLRFQRSEAQIRSILRQHISQEDLKTIAGRHISSGILSKIEHDSAYKERKSALARSLLPLLNSQGVKDKLRATMRTQAYREKMQSPAWKNANEIVELFRIGSKIGEIAEAYGCHYNTIVSILQNNMTADEYRSITKSREERYSPLRAYADQMIDMFRNGRSFGEIAKHFKTHHPLVGKIIKQNMPPDEFMRLKRRQGAEPQADRLRRGRNRLRAARISPQDIRVDSANTYASRATGDDSPSARS